MQTRRHNHHRPFVGIVMWYCREYDWKFLYWRYVVGFVADYNAGAATGRISPVAWMAIMEKSDRTPWAQQCFIENAEPLHGFPC